MGVAFQDAALVEEETPTGETMVLHGATATKEGATGAVREAMTTAQEATQTTKETLREEDILQVAAFPMEVATLLGEPGRTGKDKGSLQEEPGTIEETLMVALLGGATGKGSSAFQL